MGTTADKLQYLIDAKSSISAAIEAKGGTVPQELSGYGPAIEALPSGGSSDVAAKIVNRTVTEITATDLSGATKIGYAAFQKCTSLSSLIIPDTVTEFDWGAFSECTKLSSVAIPNSVTKIGDSSFYNCSNISSFIFGNGLTNIDIRAFRQCTKCVIYDFSSATSVPTLANVNAFQTTRADKKIIVPDALYDQWKAANNWNSSTNGIVDAITKASEA